MDERWELECESNGWEWMPVWWVHPVTRERLQMALPVVAPAGRSCEECKTVVVHRILTFHRAMTGRLTGEEQDRIAAEWAQSPFNLDNAPRRDSPPR